MPYSKIAKKKQVATSVKCKKQYDLKEDVIVALKKAEKRLIIRPLSDIADLTGTLSSYTDADVKLLTEFMKAREESFR